MSQICPVCMEEAVSYTGDSLCDYLIIEEFPELNVKVSGSSWKKDEWTHKKIMNNELNKVDMTINQFRIVSAYPHLPPASGIPNEKCYDFGLSLLPDEMISKLGVIVLGSNLCKEFTGYDLKQVQGLSNVDFLLGYDVGDMPRVVLPSIRSLYSTGNGEFSLGLSRFAKQLQGE